MAIRTYKGLVKALEKNINAAVKETADEMKEKLYECIDEQYYHDPEFYPNFYKRTETFLSSAAMRMLSSNSAEIYVDIEGMHYKNEFNSWQIVSWASESKHGSDYYQTETTDFWTTFLDWCNNNLMSILKRNLMKHGLQVK